MTPENYIKTQEYPYFRAVVEDNNDELFLGRVKVRIHGIHTADNENSGSEFEVVKTADLPWAEVMGGTGLGLVGGVGLSSVLRKGTWVWVILENNDPNKPIVVGTITGVNARPGKDVYANGEGFSDPDGKYPFEARGVETDFNRLSTAQKLSDKYYDEMCPILGLDTTIHQKIMDNLDKHEGVTDDITGADVSQAEPDSLSDKAVYPDNTVLETHSGHIIEMDDTSGNERIRMIHRTGSYMEIRPDGTFIQKCVNADTPSHFIHMNSINEHIAMGVKRYIETNVEEIITGTVMRNIQTDLKEHIAGLVELQVDKTVKEIFKDDVTRTLEKNLVEDITENVTRTVGKNIEETVSGAITLTPSGHLKIDSDVLITGHVQIDKSAKVVGNLSSDAEVSDSTGTLSSVRDHSNTHKHIGNMGSPTPPAMTPTTDSPVPGDGASISPA